MTVKSKRGRRRYIVFTVDPELTRETLIRLIPGGKRFNVIQCAGGMAVVRCAPDEVDECESAVKTAEPSAEPLVMSGTLRTLRDRYPLLKETAPPKPGRTPKTSAPKPPRGPL